MARRRNKSHKAPKVSGFSKNSNNSKDASEKEQIKVKIKEQNQSNQILEKQTELDIQKMRKRS